MKKMFLAAGAIAATVAFPAYAQSWQEIEARYSRTYTACIDSGAAAKGDQMALAKCAEAELALQETAMATALAKAEASLQPDQASALKSSQRKWLDERKSKCDEEAQCVAGDGTQRMAHADCDLDETVRRVIWLERYAP